jgi:hypothetical protein
MELVLLATGHPQPVTTLAMPSKKELLKSTYEVGILLLVAKLLTLIQGLGEAIRGNVNTFADSITGTDETKSRNVTAKGMDEINTGKYHGTGAGVTPKDTNAERLNRDLQGEGGHIGTGQSTYNTTTRSDYVA